MKKLTPLVPWSLLLILPAVAFGCDGVEPETDTATAAAGLAAEQCDGECPVAEWIVEERYEEAREVLQTRLDVSPRDLESVLLLATVELLDEEYEQAHAVVQDEIDQENYDVRLLQKRAVASLGSHDLEGALEDFAELLEELANPELEAHPAQEAAAWSGLATVQYNRGELDEAESIAQDLIDLAKSERQVDAAYGEFVMGLTSAKRGDDESAGAHYASILERYPHHAPSLNNMGGVFYRQGDLASARTYLMKAFESAGPYRETAAISWSNVGEIDLLEGDYAAAEDKLLEATSISKRTSAPHFNLAVLYDLQAKGPASREALAKALALDPAGISRWNSSWYHPDWKLQFDALIHEIEGEWSQARPLWQALLDSETADLVATAKRHLGRSEYVDVAGFE